MVRRDGMYKENMLLLHDHLVRMPRWKSGGVPPSAQCHSSCRVSYTLHWYAPFLLGNPPYVCLSDTHSAHIIFLLCVFMKGSDLGDTL